MKARYLYLTALAIILIDQASKFAVMNRLPFGSSVPALDGIVYLTVVSNRGGAFGLFQSWAGMLTMITIAVCAAIIVLVRRKVALPPFAGIALALQLGGAVGNLIDRVRFHYVVDFIDLRVWPVFNVADSAITIGIVLIAYYLIFLERGRAPAKSKG